MGGKNLGKLEQLETEMSLLGTCMDVSEPCHHRSCSEHDGTAALNQTAGVYLFFPLFNVGETTFLLSSLLVFLGNGWIGLADDIKINLA